MSKKYDFEGESQYLAFGYGRSGKIELLDVRSYTDDFDYDDYLFLVELNEDGEGYLEQYNTSEGQCYSSSEVAAFEEFADNASEHYGAFLAAQNAYASALEEFDAKVSEQVQQELPGASLDSVYSRLEDLTRNGGHWEVARNGYAPENHHWCVKARATFTVAPPKLDGVSVSVRQEKEGHLEALLTACVKLERWRENPDYAQRIKDVTGQG